ncbi:MAG: PilZ domain-containing protein [Thermoanaerobaculia bacterium]
MNTTDEPEARPRRRYPRVHGPFDGWRIDLLEVPVRIYDLSLGGCFVNSMNPQRVGAKLQLKIDLPNEGVIVVKGQSLYPRSGGFAVRFDDVDADTAERLVRTVDALTVRHDP